MSSEEVRPCRGDVYLAVLLWKALELDVLFDEKLPRGREEVRWGLMACMIAVSRFVEPSSEIHISDEWYGRTALPELLGVPVDKAEEHRLYRTLDRILPLKRDIEAHLAKRIGELFNPDLDLILYQEPRLQRPRRILDRRPFETPVLRTGLLARPPPGLPVCRQTGKQVCIALVVTKDGFPLGYEAEGQAPLKVRPALTGVVFGGNRTDVTTVEEIVGKMESRYGAASRVWVMDRGMVSQNNIEFLKKGKRRYIVGPATSAAGRSRAR